MARSLDDPPSPSTGRLAPLRATCFEPEQYPGYAAPLVRLSFALLRLRSPEDGTLECRAEDLARLCGVGRATMLRLLEHLEARAAILYRGDRLRVLNPAVLAELTGLE